MANWNEYPYTDFHQLNLDWIISKVKEYLTKVDTLEINFSDLKDYVMNYFEDLDVQEEINNKLDEMAAQGELASIISMFLQSEGLLVFNTTADLVAAQNLANGQTVLKLGDLVYNDGLTYLYKIRTLTNVDVIDNVRILALTNYPTLIAERLVSNSEMNAIRTISPIYLSEYVASDISHYPSAVIKALNKVMLFVFENNNDYGTVVIYDVNNNVKLEKKTVKIGHANSAAFDHDNQIIYVAPALEYPGGVSTPSNNIFIYDIDFNSLGTLTAPRQINSISYDRVQKKLFAFNFDYREVYQLEEDNSFTLIQTLPEFPELNLSNNLTTNNNKAFNQDIAVNNNVIYIGSPFSVIAAYDLASNTLIDMIDLTAADLDQRYYMGELEGMEFTEDDHLFAVRFSVIANVTNVGFLVEIPIKTSYATPLPQRQATYPTLSLNPTIQNTFMLPPWQISSLLMLQLRVFKGFCRVAIDGAVVDDFAISINDDMAITINSGATYTCKHLVMYASTLTLQGPGELITTAPEGGTADIRLNQGCTLFFAVASLRVRPSNTDFVIHNPAYAPEIIYKANIVNNAGGSVLIGSTALTKGVWIGEEKIATLS